MGIKIAESQPLTHELLLQAASSLDIFASQIIKDTVKKNASKFNILFEND